MTTRTSTTKGLAKPGKPQAPSGGTGGFGNARSIDTDRIRPKSIGGGTASTYFGNSRAMTGSARGRPEVVGPTSYTNFVVTKKGKK